MIKNLIPSIELFADQNSIPYAQVRLANGTFTFAVRSQAFKQLLQKTHFQKHGYALKPDDLKSTLQAAEGEAIFGGKIKSVYVRVASSTSEIIIDIGDKTSSVVRVDSSGWEILSDPPVPFHRSTNLEAIVIPQKFKGDAQGVELLKPFINVQSEDDWILIISWLLATFLPSGSFPILVVQGEQDSGKSSLTRLIRSIIDPRTEGIRRLPNSARDISIAAQHNHILAFDNLSGIAHKMSDILCTLSTGAGFATRQLYTDSDELIVNAQCPIIVNGIDEIARRPDLLSRSIVLRLPRLQSRLTESELKEKISKIMPRVLGGLLNAASIGLGRLESIGTQDLPRMADFARWVIACEPGLPWNAGDFLNAYRKNLAGSEADQLELDPLADVLLQFVDTKKHKFDTIWEGSPSDLMKILRPFDTEPDPRKQALPATPNWLMNRLKRLNPMLRSVHEIEVIQLEAKRKTHGRVVCIRRITRQTKRSPKLSTTQNLRVSSPSIP